MIADADAKDSAHAGNRTKELYNKHVLSILFPKEGGCEFEKFTPRSRAVLDHYEKKFGPLISGVLKTDETQLKRLLRLSVCYGILYFQNETGCDTEERCDFPYMNYYKYLLKRKETELLKYVDWDTPCSRTKNKINKYKIEIQMFASGVYSILNKNESHIRMAASSWHVAVAVEKVVACMIVLTLIPIAAKLYLYFSGGAPEFNDMIHSVVRFFDPRSDMARLCVAFAFPCSVFIALGYIRRRVASFIHYQRLREIYYTLYTYHLWKSRFGAGGEAENLRCGGSGTGGVPPVGKGSVVG